MSKSDPDQNLFMLVTDDPSTIHSKIRKALTDSIQGPITYDPINRPGISNLLLIASGLLDKHPQQLLATSC